MGTAKMGRWRITPPPRGNWLDCRQWNTRETSNKYETVQFLGIRRGCNYLSPIRALGYIFSSMLCHSSRGNCWRFFLYSRMFMISPFGYLCSILRKAFTFDSLSFILKPAIPKFGILDRLSKNWDFHFQTPQNVIFNEKNLLQVEKVFTYLQCLVDRS